MVSVGDFLLYLEQTVNITMDFLASELPKPKTTDINLLLWLTQIPGLEVQALNVS